MIGSFTGIVPTTRGGTSATNANAGLNNLLPAQGSSAGMFLTTDGSNTSWAAVGAHTHSAADITSGFLAIAVGGTAAGTATGALNNLLPSQTANSNKILFTDGTSASWKTISNTGTHVHDAGDITTGFLAIARGGSAAGTATGALNNLLPSQGGNSGKFLTTNGTSASWGTPAGGSVSIGGTVTNGTDGSVLFVSGTTLGQSNTEFYWSESQHRLGIHIGTNPTARLHVVQASDAGNAAIKIDSGSLLGTPEAGAIEFDGTFLYFTKNDGTRMKITAVAA